MKAFTFVVMIFVSGLSLFAQRAEFVIHISVDGLRPDGVTALGSANAPNFYRLRREGAFTDNARTDYDYTITLPNHTCQFTGRGVAGAAGHNWTENIDPAPNQTLASNKGSYIAGAFDVAHDNGLRTGEYASKTKFSLYSASWDGTNGAPDLTGFDNGRDKIDVYRNDSDTTALVNSLITDMTAQPFGYVFLHYADTDTVGHSQGWNVTPGSPYSNAVKKMDGLLGAIFSMIDGNTNLAGRTAIILTTDHGGSGTGHSTATSSLHYPVPFYVWGPGVMGGADLYALNPQTRLNPSGTSRPNYSAPIRNGEVANLALKFLGFGAVTNSTINSAQDLAVTIPPPNDFNAAIDGTNVIIRFSTLTNVLYDIQQRGDWNSGWSNVAINIPGTGGVVTNYDFGGATLPQRYYRLKIHF